MNWLSKIIVIISGVLLAIISYNVLSGWLNIIPWSIIAIVIGYLSFSKKDAIAKGILFGYFLFLTYILIGYKGSLDIKSITRILLFSIAFSLIGGIAGFIGAFIGYFIKKKTTATSNIKHR
jgi:hypothetical protein